MNDKVMTSESELYNQIVEMLSNGNFLQLNGKAINLTELNEYINAQQEEIERLNNIINELDSWLKEKKEQMEEFELYKRKETGAFWYSTMANIDTFIEKIKELKGDSSNE